MMLAKELFEMTLLAPNLKKTVDQDSGRSAADQGPWNEFSTLC